MNLNFDVLDVSDQFSNLFSNLWAWMLGIFMSIITYFIDIRPSVHVLWLAALFHVALGIYKSYRVQSEHFNIRKFADAIIVVSIFTIFLMLVYSNDKANKQDFVSTFRVTTWIITGAYMWHSLIIASTIWKNSSLFKVAIEAYKRLFKQRTGFDLPDDEDSIHNT